MATAAAIGIAVASLALAAGVCRWSWLIVDEQVRLRQDFMQLKNDQEQLYTQFEFWNQQVQKERRELGEMKKE